MRLLRNSPVLYFNISILYVTCVHQEKFLCSPTLAYFVSRPGRHPRALRHPQVLLNLSLGLRPFRAFWSTAMFPPPPSYVFRLPSIGVRADNLTLLARRALPEDLQGQSGRPIWHGIFFIKVCSSPQGQPTAGPDVERRRKYYTVETRNF